MKMTKLMEKLLKMDEDSVIDELDKMTHTGKLAKVEMDGVYAELFELDPEDGTILWDCPEHGECEADFSDLFMDDAAMLHNFLECGCGFGKDDEE
ncbi:MAG: hypothetical protein Q4B59_00945 [Lachnospiraceae bacterium]|nr:hypothetical protein [Lachnospiraceae bacterium]